MRAPVVPDGAGFGASMTSATPDKSAAFALRYLRHFSAETLTDRFVVSAFVKVQAMPLAVIGADSTVSLVANGGAVRVLTSDS